MAPFHCIKLFWPFLPQMWLNNVQFLIFDPLKGTEGIHSLWHPQNCGNGAQEHGVPHFRAGLFGQPACSPKFLEHALADMGKFGLILRAVYRATTGKNLEFVDLLIQGTDHLKGRATFCLPTL